MPPWRASTRVWTSTRRRSRTWRRHSSSSRDLSEGGCDRAGGARSPERLHGASLMAGAASLAIAVAQTASVPGDVAANVRTHLDAVEAARASGADVLVFPEMSLTGHAAGADALRLALRRDDRLIIDMA